MDPVITNSNTTMGFRVFFNFLKNEFLKQNVDLGWDFPVFGKPLDEYFSLPKDTFDALPLNYEENAKTAEFLATQLENYRTSSSSRNLQESKILVYLYTLAESEGGRFLFVTRITTKIRRQTRENWTSCLRVGKYYCCFRNYCNEFKLGKPTEVDETMIPKKRILDKYCYFKGRYVDVIPLIWCYQLDSAVERERTFGFKIRRDGELGDLPFASEFAYGSLFKDNLKQKSTHPLDSKPIDANCRKLYHDLSKESEFLGFIKDSLNTIWVIMFLHEDELEPNQKFSFKLLGCSFYF